jgi:hypothetical protein
MNKLTELKAAAEAATHPVTKGRWMYLLGDRFVYDRLEDGCRGVPQCGVDHAPPFFSDEAKRLQFIALANPATVLKLIAVVEAAQELREYLLEQQSIDVPAVFWVPLRHALKELNDD